MKGVEFYEDIETAPIGRYFEFNRLVALQKDVGSTFEDLEVRDNSALEFLAVGNIEAARKELTNKKLAIHFLKSGFHPHSHALCCMLKSIDGKKVEGFGEQEREGYIKILSEKGFSFKDVEEKVDSLKKNCFSKLVFSIQGFLSKTLIKLLT